MAQLPPPRVEELFTAKPGNAIAGACVVGDALSGTALVLLTADGAHHCLWPSGSLPSDQVLYLEIGIGPDFLLSPKCVSHSPY